MRFKDFLQEARHRRDISIEFALEILQENCKDALARADKPLWRGFRKATEDAYLVQPEGSERASANTTNHYTLIMDKFLPEQGYPKRSKSIICTNNKGEDYASNYGSLYALFPYDGVKIGVAQRRDIWDTENFSLGHSQRKQSLSQWNYWFASNIIDAGDDYQELKENIINRFARPDVAKVFRSPEEVDDILREAYSPENLKLNLADTKSIDKFEDHPREIWFSGKCVAIQYATWKRLLKEGKFKE